MKTIESIVIERIKLNEISQFIEYLINHISENGDKDILFLPISNDQMQIDSEWEKKFKSGFDKKYGEEGWRKLWIAKNQKNEIVGHIDIRSRNELNTKHRVLLGMGVDRNYRKMKIGQKLLQFVIEYSKNNKEICWIDLEVLTNNIPAIKLYLKNDFEVLVNIVDMFRIESKSYDYTSMTLNVKL